MSFLLIVVCTLVTAVGALLFATAEVLQSGAAIASETALTSNDGIRADAVHAALVQSQLAAKTLPLSTLHHRKFGVSCAYAATLSVPTRLHSAPPCNPLESARIATKLSPGNGALYALYAAELNAFKAPLGEVFNQLYLANRFAPYKPDTILTTAVIGLEHWNELNTPQRKLTESTLSFALAKAKQAIFARSARAGVLAQLRALLTEESDIRSLDRFEQTSPLAGGRP